MSRWRWATTVSSSSSSSVACVEMCREFIVTVKKNHGTRNEVSLTGKDIPRGSKQIFFPFSPSSFVRRSVRPGFKFEIDAETFFHFNSFLISKFSIFFYFQPIIFSLFHDISICIFRRNIFQSIIKYRIAQLSLRFLRENRYPHNFTEGNVLIHQTHLSGWSANKLILACRVYTRLVRDTWILSSNSRHRITTAEPINTDSDGYRSPWRGRQKVGHCMRNGSACGVR